MRYANIEHECLSVVFGLEKFHIYIYGRHIKVYKDHKPLEMITKKPIHAAPSRLQRILLQLQKYDYTLIYKPGKEMTLAFTPDRINIITIERDPILSTVYQLTLNG